MQPERFGRYEVVAEIGDGSMGRVYKARDPVVERFVAIKTIKSEYLTRDQAKEYLKRFRREAQAAGSLNHPNIVRIFDVGENHLVMEMLEGQTLQQLIREGGPMEPEQARAILSPVADALDHAHASGIIHRDIKPANIMIQTGGQPKLMDFGVAHLDATVMTATGQILGSPSFMSPEQLLGENVTPRFDNYSLAVVAYEMLTGQSPFPGKTITAVIYRVMHEEAPSPRKLNASLPDRYDKIFAKALAKDPTKRYASATDFSSALNLRDSHEAEKMARKVAKIVINEIRVFPERTRSDRKFRKDAEKAIYTYARYGVFDAVELSVDAGVVTLQGFVLDNHRRREFEDRLARIEGVRDVHNDLRLQGRSSLDERLRLRLYARIYNDPRFAQYASWPEPPVRIFVDHGRVTLAGTVRSKVEQAALGYMARESLAFSVKNVVQVEGSVPKEDQPRNEG